MNVYDLEDDLKISTHETQNETATLISQSSGWTIKSVYGHQINIVQYNPFKGSSHVKLPSESMNSTKGLINIKNNDNCNASVVNIYSTNTKLTV